MRVILLSLVISCVLTLISLVIVRVDLTYHDIENGKVYDLKDEIYFYTSYNSKNKSTCDVMCSLKRGFPFAMISYPSESGIKAIPENILMNFLHYYVVVYIILLFMMVYNSYYNRTML